MADIKVTGEANFTSVTTGMQKIGKDADNLKRKVDRMGGGKSGSQRGGMGILEISRGVEDFAVAGMRGLMNNIPGIIMSLGGGMGLAGAISLAAVGLSVFGKSLMGMVAQADTASETVAKLDRQTTKFAEGLRRLKKEKADAALALEIGGIKSDSASLTEGVLGRSANVMDAFNEAGDVAAQTRSIADAIAALNAELAQSRGETPIVDLSKGLKRAEEDADSLKQMIGDLSGETSVLEGALKMNAAGGNASAEIEKLNLELAKSESIIAGFDAELKSLEEKAGAMGTEIKDSLIKSFTDTIPRMMGMGDAVDRIGTTFSFGQQIGQKIDIAKGELETQQKLKRELESSLAIKKAEAEAAKMSSDEISKAISKNREELDSARTKEASMQRQIAAEKEMLAIRKQIQNAKVEQAFGEIDSILAGMRINGGDLLSSKGRIGGSATEFNSAIATINYQRESLKELRTIARNTAKNRVATYQ